LRVEYTVTYNPSAASNWFTVATPFWEQFEDDIDDYNRYVSKANAHYSDAAPYEEKVSIYGAQTSTHANILAGFQDRREAYEGQAAPFFGRWADRATAGNACINWSQDDPISSLYSLVETAKANGLEPYAYLRYLFTKLPTAESLEDFEALLPGNIEKNQILAT